MRTLLRIAEAVAQEVAAARHGRALHPHGRTFRATVRTSGSGAYGVDLFAPGRDYPALARLSRGAGLPGRWPDILGVALRIHRPDPDGDVDLLASTTMGKAPVVRHIPFPRRRIATTYTTVIGYGTRHGRRYLAVLPDPASADLGADLDAVSAAVAGGGASLLLAAAARRGGWQVFGKVLLGEPLPADVDARLAFDPVLHAAAGLHADGAVWRLRAATYEGSRRGRGAEFATPPIRGWPLAAGAAGRPLSEGH